MLLTQTSGAALVSGKSKMARRVSANTSGSDVGSGGAAPRGMRKRQRRVIRVIAKASGKAHQRSSTFSKSCSAVAA